MNVDLTRRHDENDHLYHAEPAVIGREIGKDLTAALAEFEAVAATLEKGRCHHPARRRP